MTLFPYRNNLGGYWFSPGRVPVLYGSVIKWKKTPHGTKKHHTGLVAHYGSSRALISSSQMSHVAAPEKYDTFHDVIIHCYKLDIQRSPTHAITILRLNVVCAIVFYGNARTFVIYVILFHQLYYAPHTMTIINWYLCFFAVTCQRAMCLQYWLICAI